MRLIVLAACTLLLCGCARHPNFHVSVSALAAPRAESARRYVLIPGNEDVQPQDLQFQEYAGYIRNVLDMQGFSQVEDPKNAEIIIVLAYSIGDPQQQSYTYSIPQWGQTGYSSATTYGTLYTSGNYGSYTGQTYFQPTYGITGYSTGVGTVVTYTRAMALVAYDAGSLSQDNKPTEVWRVSAASTGRSGDLRLVFPYLVAGARPYIGRATQGRAVNLVFKYNDKRVLEVQGIQRAKK